MVVRDVHVPIVREVSIGSVFVRNQLVSFRPTSNSAGVAIIILPMEVSILPKRW